jgi:hypothetical protein
MRSWRKLAELKMFAATSPRNSGQATGFGAKFVKYVGSVEGSECWRATFEQTIGQCDACLGVRGVPFVLSRHEVVKRT